MLNVSFFTFNAFQENTYIISNEKKQCWIVDPGMYDKRETEQIISYISENKLQPQAIINTHAHIDHIFGVQPLIDKYNIPFGLYELETEVLKMAAGSAVVFGFDDFKQVPKPTFFIKTGTLQLGDDTLEVYFTPGHSPGSISFYYAPGKWVIAGDVLFSGSIGRTDLPGGNFDTLLNSIRTHLFTLPDETIVLSGHGPETTIGHEKKYNPFLQ
jgi:glyoxylase-like metal-dependent hydrolase (beta-lactamase superfamily II)